MSRDPYDPQQHQISILEEIRDAIFALNTNATEIRTIDNCIAVVRQSLDSVMSEDDGESRTIKVSIAAREHVIALLESYRAKVIEEPR